MNLNFSELTHTCNDIRSHFILDERWRFGKVQKIFGSAKVISLNVRIPGKTLFLGIGRGSDFCGMWELGKTVPSTHRIVRDKLLEYLRSNLKGKSITNVVSDEKDRCIKIICHDKSEFLFFWKGRRLHFSHLELLDNQLVEFSPWKSMKKTEVAADTSFSVFDEIGRKQLSHKEVRNECHKLDFEKLYSGQKTDTKEIKKLKKKVGLIDSDLKKCGLWQELQELAIADTMDLSKDRITWKGLKLKFDKDSTHYQRRDKLFTKIKKLKIGETFLSKRLVETKEELLGKKERGMVIENVVFPVWIKKEIKKEPVAKKEDGSVFLQWGEFKIAIGTSAQSNDQLRKTWAKKNDFWFHLDEYTSAHLFVKGLDSLEQEILSVFASILADYSGFKDTQIPIVFTKVCNIKGVKGLPGTVNFKKEKHLFLKSVNWKEIISTGW